ncbi:hypothetical protein [Clavibacter tessellarius]|uniref:hypothetical protein n=1 Tax=Clavibacter tessellarius TaxID=31965 RepID=UPI00324E21F9
MSGSRPAAGSRRPRVPAGSRDPGRTLVPVLALALLTGLGAAAFWPVHQDASFLRMAGITIAVGAAVAVAGARLRWGARWSRASSWRCSSSSASRSRCPRAPSTAGVPRSTGSRTSWRARPSGSCGSSRSRCRSATTRRSSCRPSRSCCSPPSSAPPWRCAPVDPSSR